MELENVARYLSHKLPDAEDLRVERLRRSYPGMSRETWLADVSWLQDGQTVQRGFVFRLDTPGGSVCPTPLSREYEAYKRLYGTPVPVPKPLWYDTETEWLADGREFYVRDKVEGIIEIPHLYDPDSQYDELRMLVAKEHVEKLAALHNVDWRKVGFGEVLEVPPNEANCARFDLDLWEDIFDRVRVEPFPVVREVFCWLKDHQPPAAPRISLLKGNNGVGEEIWQGTRIVGMSDWELVHLGDPAEDWCWIELNSRIGAQGIDTTLFDEPRLIEHYEKVSGIHLGEERLSYYHILHWLKALICSITAGRVFSTGRELRVAMASMAVGAHRSQLRLAKTVGILD